MIFQTQDMTLETVTSFLQTGKLYEINPMTGDFYEQGIPTRLKIFCLPTLYAAIGNAFKLNPETVVWHLVPAATLLLSYVSYGALGKTLFPDDEKNRRLFLTIVALLFFAGSYAYGMEGFGLFHVGFQGTTIRNAVLLPWLFSLCLRKKWLLTILVVAAEACITWTLYGLGMGLIIIVAFGGHALWHKVTSGRKEAAS